ncbi:MAG: carboxypeptidase regulatory-like domain-containing protein [Chlorobiales bacterium]|nr:carboxypeptidase regulatory-like domain-containing protein [Chlorobiales bacterium]
MRKYTVFLASSAELNSDKEQVELFISRKNKDLHKKRVDLELSTWKDFISAMTEEHSQEKYNAYIRTCDIAIFLFHTKLGRFTKEEFDTAHKAFKEHSGHVKKPLIYTYFKTAKDEAPEITAFRTYIDGLEHFYDTYDSTEALFVHLNRQLDKLENEGIIHADPIDVPKLIRNLILSVLPVLLVASVVSAYYFFQPLSMTVKVREPNPIPGLPFRSGTLSLTYGDKTETLEIKDEAMFRQVPSKFKRSKLRLVFHAKGFLPIDTLIDAGEIAELPIRRDSSLAIIFGIVKNEDNQPEPDVLLSVGDLQSKTGEQGKFRIVIPLEKQAEEQRLTAYKEGFQLWDETFPVVAGEETHVILKK